MKKVFLSYAHSDLAVARQVATQLEDAGHKVWFADDAIFMGKNFALEAGKALEKSDAMVVLISPESMKSDWVRRDIDFALSAPQYRGRLIPVIVKPTAKIPWILKKFPNVQFGRRVAEAGREIAGYVKNGFELVPS